MAHQDRGTVEKDILEGIPNIILLNNPESGLIFLATGDQCGLQLPSTTNSASGKRHSTVEKMADTLIGRITHSSWIRYFCDTVVLVLERVLTAATTRRYLSPRRSIS